MRLTALLLSMYFPLLLSSFAIAQDSPPYLDLVRGLRERGYNDLAMSYLEKLRNQPQLPSALKAVLPLELARNRSEVAGNLPSSAERDQLLTLSRQELEDYLKNNPSEEWALEAQYVLGNVLAEQARSLSASSDRASDNRIAAERIQQTLIRFDEADKQFASLQKKLEDQLGIKLAPGKTPSKQLQLPSGKSSPLYLNTLYYRALARYDKSRVSGLSVREAGIANDEARQLAEKLSLYRGNSSAGWQGYALLARTLEGADDIKANQIYRQIDSASTANAVLAQRAIRYFPLARADASGELTERGSERERIKSQAERWLQLYGSTTGNARDAQHVRFMLIRILAKELEEVPENRRQTAESQQKLDRALALIESMDNGRTDHQESLERLKYTVLRLSGRAKGSLETIKTFDEALLRSSMEFYNQQILEAKLREVGDAPARVDVESQFREQVHATLSALRRTQELMEYTSVSERNRIRILNMMQACYRRVNDGPRAALICEHLAYSARQPEIAQSAAGEALRLYQFLSSDGGKLDTTAHARLFSVAKFLEERYPDSPQADEARSILGRDLIARKQYDPAIQLLTKVKSKPGVSLYLAGLASWSKYLESNKNNPPKKTAEVSQALELLQRSISSLQAQTQKDDIEQRTEVQAALLLLGIHDSLGETNAVIASAEPLLKRIEDKQMPTGITVGTELQVLETVMNAYIQNKDFVNGPKRILAILDKRKNDNSLGNSTRFLQSTALRIRSQLDEFQKQGASTKTAYEAVLNSFRLFLEQIDKSAELQSSQRVWLANSYMVIGDFAKAVRVLENIKEPQSKQSSDAKDGDENEQQWFRQASALLIQALREMAMLEEDANDRDKQLSVVERELQKIMQEPWAKRNPNLLRDEIYLLQLRGKYSGRTGAITRWDQFRNVLAPLHTKNDAMKELYWEAWHNLAYCVFKEAQILRNPEAKQKAVNRAAALIAEAKRENYGTLTQAARFRELLSNPQHSELQAAFERMQTPAKK